MSNKNERKYYSIGYILKEKKYFDFIIGEREKGRKYEKLKRANTPKVRG